MSLKKYWCVIFKKKKNKCMFQEPKRELYKSLAIEYSFFRKSSYAKGFHVVLI